MSIDHTKDTRKIPLFAALLTVMIFISNCSQEEESTDRRSSDQGILNGPSLTDTNCGARLDHWSTRPSACIVVKDQKALLVHVRYGSSPGWDFPGGYHKGNEPACRTAERETCEETGYAVRAIEKLTGNVFKCEIYASNACTVPVDEGFLEKRWVSRQEVDRVNYRGGTWGDKRALLKQVLTASEDTGSGALDDCGCRIGIEGWSTTNGRCSSTSETDDWEAEQCRQQNGESTGPSEEIDLDDCGCKIGIEGWSTTNGRCSSTSETDDWEAEQCRQQNGESMGESEFDDCGCKIGIEGWSTTKGRCSSTSETDDWEAEQCRNHLQLDACGCVVGIEGWSSTNGRCSRESKTEKWEADQCRN